MTATAYQLPISDKAATRAGPGVWRKQILPIGSINYKTPQGDRRLDFTKEYLQDLAAAFDDKAFDQLPFQMADKDNTHTLDPERTRGVFTGLEVTNDGLYGFLKPTPKGEEVLRDNPGLGVSVRIVEGYERADGKKYPIALQHVLGTIDPRVVAMKPWEPADQVALASGDHTQVVDLTAATFTKGEQMPDTALAPDEVERVRALLAGVKTDDKKDNPADDTVSDEELQALLASLDDDDETEPTPAEIAAANAVRQDVALANSRATENSIELAEIRKELDKERWKNIRAEYLRKGVKPAVLDIAGVADLAVARGGAIDLSNGTKVDPASVVLALLKECEGQVDLSNAQGSPETGDGVDPVDAMLEIARTQFGK